MSLLVNGERIDDAALRDERRNVRRLLAGQMPDEDPAILDERARDWARDNLIEQVLLHQAAMRDPAPVRAEDIDTAIKADGRELQPGIEKKLRLERFLGTLTAHVGKPRNKDVVEYYRKNRKRFYAPEAVSARHIVKNVDEDHSEESARTAIEEIRDALRSRVPFEKLADELSDCPGNGGDLGYFARGQMAPEFETVAFSARTGETSDIFRTAFGFHILRVDGRREEGIPPLEAVRAQIEEHLFVQKSQKVIEQYVDSLRAKADIREV